MVGALTNMSVAFAFLRSALETLMEIELTVDVLQGDSLMGPLAENDEYLVAFGIGGSLQEALQEATIRLARSIEGVYKLKSAEVAVLFGTSMRFDVAELVAPHISM